MEFRIECLQTLAQLKLGQWLPCDLFMYIYSEKNKFEACTQAHAR